MAIQRRLVEAVEVTENRVHVIRLKGIFDASTVSEFEKVVSYLLTRNFYKVIVDLGHVEFISSAGWGTFTAELRRVRENQGDVKLANMNPDVYDVFLLLELDSFIQSFDTVEEALAAFAQPVVAPEPEPARPSILQEIKAAAHAREMAEAGARTAAEKLAPDFSESWRQRTVAGQETYATAFAVSANEKAVFAGAPRDNERAFDKAAPLKEKAVGAPRDKDNASGRFEYPDEPSATRGERKTTAPNDAESFGGQSEYVIGSGAAEAEYYSDSSPSPRGQYGPAEQTEYADDDYAGETERTSFSLEARDAGDITGQSEYAGGDYADASEYENYSAGSEDESGVVEQEEYAGDAEAGEGEYENYSANSENEFDAVEQAEYAGGGYADETEYNDSSAESYGEDGVTGQVEYAGDGYVDETEYDDSSAEPYGEDGVTEQAEYSGDGYADETEYDDSSAESYGEDGVTGQAEYSGDGYAEETEYDDSSAESYSEDGVTEQAEYAGDVYADETEYDDSSTESYSEDGVTEQAENASEGYVSEDEHESSSSGFEDEYGAIEQADLETEAQNDYAIAEDDGESGSDHLTPPVPPARGPEMWELILAGGEVPVDPYMYKKSARRLPEEKEPPGAFVSGGTNPFSGRPNGEDSLPDAQSENSAPATRSDADGAFDEFAELGASPDLGFAGHEPFVDDNNQPGRDSAPASARASFEHAPVRSSPHRGNDDDFDEFETQDIRDPWIFDEIDTLPEEYEMEGGAADGEEPSFSATELLSYDLELDEPLSPLPDQARDYGKAGAESELSTHFEASLQAGDEHAFDKLHDLPARDVGEEAQAESGFARQNKKRAMLPGDGLQENFSAPSLSGKNLNTPRDDSFAPPAKFEKKRAARNKKSRPKENFFAPPDLDEHGELIAPGAASQSLYDGNDEARHAYPPDGALPKIPASDNIEEMVRAVVATHPEFGAAMICKFIEDRFEPPVLISRSTVYRFLREADLNTREKRQEYAEQLFDPSVLTEEI
ncbi:MAG: anti-sigma factor antagonist [bacterium]